MALFANGYVGERLVRHGLMEAQIHEHDNWWWAWTLAPGWPRLKFHAHFKDNEHEPTVHHFCVMGFGYSLEIRWELPRWEKISPTKFF